MHSSTKTVVATQQQPDRSAATAAVATSLNSKHLHLVAIPLIFKIIHIHHDVKGYTCWLIQLSTRTNYHGFVRFSETRPDLELHISMHRSFEGLPNVVRLTFFITFVNLVCSFSLSFKFHSFNALQS